ncbi:MAG: hypothetical protein V4616_13180, partial [Bacteroidota bacterium]
MERFYLRFKVILPLLIGVLLCGQLSAQKENNNWYFGYNAGVTFNTSPPTVLANGQLRTFAGCATASNSAGQLLFYTDGISVYNSNHVRISSALRSTHLADQGARIIPFIGDPTRFYITTTVSTNTALVGMFSSVVSGVSPTGGGTVAAPVRIPGIDTLCIEKQEIIPNSDYTGYWFIVKTIG